MSFEWAVRKLQLQRGANEVHVYLTTGDSDAASCEWSLNDVTALVWQSANHKTRSKSFRSIWALIAENYKDLFRSSIPDLRQCMSDKRKDETKAMMYERTLSTNTLCAFLVSALTAVHASQREPHMRTCGLVFELLRKICDSSEARSVTIRHLGTGRQIVFDVNQRISSKQVWCESVRSSLEAAWEACCEDADRVWHRSTCQNITIPEFVVFGLDGLGPMAEFSFLRIAAQDLLKQCLAALTPTCLNEITVETTLSSGPALLGTTSKVRRGAAVRAYFEACSMVARGDVSQPAFVAEAFTF